MNAEQLTKHLVDENMPLVKLIASKMAMRLPDHVQFDDLMQWGSIGLLDAIKKFDPDRGNQFRTYAEWRIRGSILDGLRSDDTTARSSRDMQKTIDAIAEEFRKEFQRTPSPEEMAEKLGKTTEEFFEIQDKIHPISTLPIDKADLFSPDDRKALLVSLQNKSPDIESKVDAMNKLLKIVEGHEPTNRACFMLFYIWGFKLEEIGDLFDCTPSRISQRIKMVHLREKNGYRNSRQGR